MKNKSLGKIKCRTIYKVFQKNQMLAKVWKLFKAAFKEAPTKLL